MPCNIYIYIKYMRNCARKDIHEPKKLSPSNSLSLKYELGNNLRKTLKKN